MPGGMDSVTPSLKVPLAVNVRLWPTVWVALDGDTDSDVSARNVAVTDAALVLSVKLQLGDVAQAAAPLVPAEYPANRFPAAATDPSVMTDPCTYVVPQAEGMTESKS